jgi:lysozyme
LFHKANDLAALAKSLEFSAKIMPMIKVPVTDNQFSACVSLSYNIGDGAFSRSSVLKYINAKDFANAAKSFALWNKGVGKVLPGLVKRRESEKQLFLKK